VERGERRAGQTGSYLGSGGGVSDKRRAGGERGDVEAGEVGKHGHQLSQEPAHTLLVVHPSVCFHMQRIERQHLNLRDQHTRARGRLSYRSAATLIWSGFLLPALWNQSSSRTLKSIHARNAASNEQTTSRNDNLVLPLLVAKGQLGVRLQRGETCQKRFLASAHPSTLSQDTCDNVHSSVAWPALWTTRVLTTWKPWPCDRATTVQACAAS
jgi:hypothetical protein